MGARRFPLGARRPSQQRRVLSGLETSLWVAMPTTRVSV